MKGYIINAANADSTIDPYQNLANAIVLQAAQDYRHFVESKGKCGKDCEWFFKSEWFQSLTDLDGEYLLNEIKKRS